MYLPFRFCLEEFSPDAIFSILQLASISSQNSIGMALCWMSTFHHKQPHTAASGMLAGMSSISMLCPYAASKWPCFFRWTRHCWWNKMRRMLVHICATIVLGRGVRLGITGMASCNVETAYLCRMCDWYSFRRGCSHPSWLLEGTRHQNEDHALQLPCVRNIKMYGSRWHPTEKDCVLCGACYACFWLLKKDRPKEPLGGLKKKISMPPRGIEPRTFSWASIGDTSETLYHWAIEAYLASVPFRVASLYKPHIFRNITWQLLRLR